MATLRLQLDPSQMNAGVGSAEAALESVKREAIATETAVELLGQSMINVGQRAHGASRRLSAATSANRAFAGQVQNASYQFADLIVQATNGVNIFTAIGQQLPQLLGGFGLFGAVLGAVAAGAVPLIAYLRSQNDASKVLEESIKALNKSLEEYEEISKNAAMSTDDLSERFGSQAAEAKALYEELKRIKQLELGGGLAGLRSGFMQTDPFGSTEMFGLRRSRRRERQEVGLQAQLAANVDNAGNIDEQVAAFDALLENTIRLADLNGSRNASELEYIQYLSETLLKLRELQTTQSGEVEAAKRSEAAYKQYYDSRVRGAELAAKLEQDALDRFATAQEEYVNSRLRGEEFLANERQRVEDDFRRTQEEYVQSRLRGQELLEAAQAREADRIGQTISYYVQMRNESDAAASAANDMLADMQAQADMVQLVALYGEDSLRVTTARAQAERDAYEETVRSMDVSDAMKQALMEAYDAANGIASVDMAGNISLAVAEAAKLAEQMRAAQVGPSSRRGTRAGTTGLAVTESVRPRSREEGLFDEYFGPPDRTSRGGGGRGRGGKSEAEKLDEEYERLIGTLDPLASATQRFGEAQRIINAQLSTGVITSEEAAGAYALAEEQYNDMLKRLEETDGVVRQVQGVFTDFFVGLVKGSADASDALGRLGDMLLNTAFNELFSGFGVFEGLGEFFGGKKRAAGGAVNTGSSYLVGENGPEIFRPSGNGTILPNHSMGGSSPSLVFAPVINAAGADKSAIDQVRRDLQQMKADFQGMVHQTLRVGKYRRLNKNWESV